MSEALFVAVINGTPSYSFKFRALSLVDNTKQQPAIFTPLPNTNGENSLYFRFNGQEEIMELDFAIFPSSEDLSDIGNGQTAPSGDFPAGVQTLSDQIKYLRDYVFDSDFATYWQLTISSLGYTNKTVILERVSFNLRSGSARNIRTGVLIAKIGQLAGIS